MAQKSELEITVRNVFNQLSEDLKLTKNAPPRDLKI